MAKPKIKTETVNEAITIYKTKDGKEITEDEYYGRKTTAKKEE